MRIGVLSGTFDPVHLGHMSVAEAVIVKYELDKFVFLPEANPRSKNSVTSMEHRLAMLRLIASSNPAYDVHLSKQDQHNLETMADLKAAYPNSQLFLIVGSDVADNMSTWDGYEEISKTLDIVVVARSGHNPVRQPDISLHLPISSLEIRRSLAAGNTEHRIPSSVASYIEENKLYKAQAF